MKLTEEQKSKIEEILRQSILYEADSGEQIKTAIRQIKSLIGPEWVVMCRPINSSPDGSKEFVIGNKERVYTITLAPNNFNTEDKEW